MQIEQYPGSANLINVTGTIMPGRLPDGTAFGIFLTELPTGSVSFDQLTHRVTSLLENRSPNPLKDAEQLVGKFIESPNLARISSPEQPVYSTFWQENFGEQIYFSAQNIENITSTKHVAASSEEREVWPTKAFLLPEEWELIREAFAQNRLQETAVMNWPEKIVVDYPFEEIKERFHLPEGSIWLDDLEAKLIELMNRASSKKHHKGSVYIFRRNIFYGLTWGKEIVRVSLQSNELAPSYLTQHLDFLTPEGVANLQRTINDKSLRRKYRGIRETRISYLRQALEELFPAEEQLDQNLE